MSDRLSLIPSCTRIASSSLAAASPTFRGCHVADRPQWPLCVLALVSNIQFPILRRCHRLHRHIVVVLLLLLLFSCLCCCCCCCPVADLLPTPIRAKQTKTKPSCLASSGHLAVMRLNYTSDFHCSALISARYSLSLYTSLALSGRESVGNRSTK